jgi:hypothetical protein
MRLDAVKAEADRKARQKQMEVGLPAFHETQPLTGRVEGNAVYLDDDTAASPVRRTQGNYLPAAPGNRTIDDYYNPAVASTTYPPPQRQPSGHSIARHVTGSTQAPTYATNYAPSARGQEPAQPYPFAAANAYNDPYEANPRQEYGHTAGGTTCEFAYVLLICPNISLDHSTASHQQYSSAYEQHNAFAGQPDNNAYGSNTGYTQPGFAPQDSFTPNPHGYASEPQSAYSSAPQTFYSANSTPQAPERGYTLGGDGYGASSVPPLPTHNDSYFPAPINTAVAPATGPVLSPRGQRAMSPETYNHAPPPSYELTPSPSPGIAPGQWGSKR